MRKICRRIPTGSLILSENYRHYALIRVAHRGECILSYIVAAKKRHMPIPTATLTQSELLAHPVKHVSRSTTDLLRNPAYWLVPTE